MVQRATEIQKRSDAKRGVKTWGTKLPIPFIKRLKTLSVQINKPQSQIIMEAIDLYEETLEKETQAS